MGLCGACVQGISHFALSMLVYMLQMGAREMASVLQSGEEGREWLMAHMRCECRFLCAGQPCDVIHPMQDIGLPNQSWTWGYPTSIGHGVTQPVLEIGLPNQSWT